MKEIIEPLRDDGAYKHCAIDCTSQGKDQHKLRCVAPNSQTFNWIHKGPMTTLYTLNIVGNINVC